MTKLTPKEWLYYLGKNGLAVRTFPWKFDGRRKDNKKDLKCPITYKKFLKKYCVY